VAVILVVNINLECLFIQNVLIPTYDVSNKVHYASNNSGIREVYVRYTLTNI